MMPTYYETCYEENMSKERAYDAIVVGSGPNGLAAAITLAQAGLSVIVFEAKNTIGGGLRSAELTLPGFIHDICSAIHPLGIASPFFRQLTLEQHGVEWIHPLVPLAHPFDDGKPAILDRSINLTGQTLGIDHLAYQKLMGPLAANWNQLASDILAPLRLPRHPWISGQFALLGLRSAQSLANHRFEGQRARALFAGLAAHSFLPLDGLLTAAFGLVLGTLGHVAGWPMVRGGSQQMAQALASILRMLGGEIVTNHEVENLESLPPAQAVLLDVTPRQLMKIAKNHLPSDYLRKLGKYRYGPGVFKMDWALHHSIPWKAKECAFAGTVHVGGTWQEIAQSEREIWQGKYSEKPFLLVAQPSLFDRTRAPEGKHTAWAYCHVPNGSAVDMTTKIESQIERFAPGFKDCILSRSTRSSKEMEQHNPNYVGGDINGGVQDIYQFLRRPVSWFHPYSTPTKGIYLCSSSTPPGGGVHGMCGYHAACVALKECFHIQPQVIL
jgi:phytoene dehydrogenase-like protein